MLVVAISHGRPFAVRPATEERLELAGQGSPNAANPRLPWPIFATIPRRDTRDAGWESILVVAQVWGRLRSPLGCGYTALYTRYIREPWLCAVGLSDD